MKRIKKALHHSKDDSVDSFKRFASTSYEGQTFLHGHLNIEVKSASDLPDLESFLSKLVDKKDVSDPYVDVKLGEARLVKTSIVSNNLNPVWNEDYRIEVCHFAEHLVFEVRDKDHAKSEFIGSVSIPTSMLLSEEVFENHYPIKKKNGHHKGKLELKIQYISTASVERTYEVDCYFPMRRNCHVTLYQDAHCPKHLQAFEKLEKPSGKKYKPESCWKDVYKALIKAEHIICITGWSVWTKLKLLRGEDAGKDGRTLGEILVDKANNGVQVYMLVWSDKTNIMGTHDDETRDFFRDTRVNCGLIPREIATKELTDVLQNQFSSGTYSHHQKSIICDTKLHHNSQRGLVAFVGGLDLTNGRWDTPDHELFKTIQNEHLEDFYQSNAPSIPATQGPRQPWKDIHSKVEGPIAHDVFMNFFERWNRQGQKYGHLRPIDLTKIDVNAPGPTVQKHPRKAWNVQFFRSITSDSAQFDPNKTHLMNSKKGRVVDASIAQAYVQMIRNADRFIYIENQYFLGSAYCWLEDQDTNCNHTIPSELTQRIVEKIHKKERFCVYILIPMFPEGNPSSQAGQEVLYWQAKTIEMMYKRIGEAIAQVGIDSKPQEWLLFLCPGKREGDGPWLDHLEKPTDDVAKLMRRTKRGPIYVHSKMMIVDDVYIILGSANINQRSMSGTRDTEIAVGCYQPSFVEDNPFGEVHNFRMALWAGLTRTVDPAFRYPGTIECIGKIRHLAEQNWQAYVGPDGSVTPGMLLPYPIHVLPNGFVQTLPGHEEFPDFPDGSKVLGKKSAVLPQKLTT